MHAMRRSLFACCAALLQCLSRCAYARTVSPFLYLTTATPPSPYRAPSNGYSGAVISYKGGSGHKGPAVGYYGPTGGVHHHGPGGGHAEGPVGGQYRYGQRPLPPRVRRGRDEQGYALYESPNTYEYMTDPRKKNERSRLVPGTERRPPGIEDVEIIDLRRPGGGGSGRHGEDRETENDRKKKKKNKKKKKRKTPTADTEVMGSSVHKNGGQRSAATRPVGGPDKRKNKNDAKGGHGPGKHEVHKKNEYSKKRHFFDEEHAVDRDPGSSRPKKKRPSGTPHQSGADRKEPGRYREKRKRSSKKDTNDRLADESKSHGYGQVMVVR